MFQAASTPLVTLALHDAVSWTVGWTVGFVMGTILVRGIARPVWRNLVDSLREHLLLTREAADRLDTRTEGGLRDVVEELARVRDALHGK